MGQTITFPRLLNGDTARIPGFKDAMSIFTAPFVYPGERYPVKATLYRIAVEAFAKHTYTMGDVFWNAIKNFFPSEHVLFANEIVNIISPDHQTGPGSKTKWKYIVARSLRTLLKYRSVPVAQVVMCRINLMDRSKDENHAALAVFFRQPDVVSWTMTTLNLHHNQFMPIEDIVTGLQYALAPTIIVAAPVSKCEEAQGDVGNCVGWGFLFAFYISANPAYMDAPDKLLRRIQKHEDRRKAASQLIVEFYFFMCIHAIYVHGVHVVRDYFADIPDIGLADEEEFTAELGKSGFKSTCDIGWEDTCDPGACIQCMNFCVDKKTIKSGCDFYSVRDLLLKMYDAIDIH